MSQAAAIERAARLIADADGLLITAGAGMGVDSGLPDFRGRAGFWRAYPALAKARIDFEEAASPDTFRRNARLGWGFYGHRLALYRRTVPHEGFHILRRWAARLPHGAFVFTSNVDGQFAKAGFDPAHICEIHGSIHHLQCLEPCAEHIWPADAVLPEVDDDTCLLTSDLPHCPRCGRLARPNILMFGDWNWLRFRTDSQSVGLHAWLRTVERPVVIELGAGRDIATVRKFSERVQGTLIRINPRDTSGPAGTLSIALGAREGLALLAAALADH